MAIYVKVLERGTRFYDENGEFICSLNDILHELEKIQTEAFDEWKQALRKATKES